MLDLTLHHSGPRRQTAAPNKLVMAGWTGRDADAAAKMLSPSSLLALYSDNGTLPEGTLKFCGTLAAIGGIRSANRFECELIDPVLQRTISCSYDITVLQTVI